ncbi:sulfite exporter TauE/SafE family protein [Candidatus Woesearchaeota archaeon]|nr:sulfite exporter TauE/SafE family protein [Candidatus Woesearchaeota archaeon]
MAKQNAHLFLNSVAFVLGFSVVFSAMGVSLQTTLSSISFELQGFLAKLGGIIIIFFGLYLLNIVKVPFLQKEIRISVHKKFSSAYISSFVFGAAFAIGWSPCVGAILGAILALAISYPALAFFLMVAYSLGLSIPFLIVGYFADEARGWVKKYTASLRYASKVFGAILIVLGVLVFTGNLGAISSLECTDQGLGKITHSLLGNQPLHLGIAFLAGLVSFLSPCVLPLIPAFLTYLASLLVKH